MTATKKKKVRRATAPAKTRASAPAEPFDYKGEFDRLMIIVQAAATISIDIDGLAHHHEMAHTLGPLLDPTAYMRGMGNLDQQAEVLRLAIPFVRGCRALKTAAGAPR